MTFKAPYPLYDPTDKDGFSYATVIKRWPVILTSIIDYLYQSCHTLVLEQKEIPEDDVAAKTLVEEKLEEGKGIIEQLSKLKYEMARDRAMPPIPDDGQLGKEHYNQELKALEDDKKNTWFTCPWLYAECYLYRFLRSLFVQTKHWKADDPFYEQKMSTFRHSGDAIIKIASTMHELGKVQVKPDKDGLRVLFNEMIQMCLWGNATDLSLLTHMSEADIKNLQSVGKEAQAARQQFLLRDDQDKVWSHLITLKDARIDFVLDNSGFELFTDLVFADFLVTHTPYVGKVVFHPKLIPWFVSDVTPPDFKDTFTSLLDPSFFADGNTRPAEQQDALKEMVQRWKMYVDNGVFALSVPIDTPLGGVESGAAGRVSNAVKAAEFWTTSKPYWDLKDDAPLLFESLEKSGLVIFKGDLNYRKLTGDIKWPSWTPFEEAIGPLAGSFPLLSLRTNKADVAVGVEKSVVEKMDASGEKWRVDGRYALVSFLGRH